MPRTVPTFTPHNVTGSADHQARHRILKKYATTRSFLVNKSLPRRTARRQARQSRPAPSTKAPTMVDLPRAMIVRFVLPFAMHESVDRRNIARFEQFRMATHARSRFFVSASKNIPIITNAQQTGQFMTDHDLPSLRNHRASPGSNRQAVWLATGSSPADGSSRNSTPGSRTSSAPRVPSPPRHASTQSGRHRSKAADRDRPATISIARAPWIVASSSVVNITHGSATFSSTVNELHSAPLWGNTTPK